MASLTYTALRNIAPGHSISTEYDMDFIASAIDRSVRSINTSLKSIDGTPKTIHKRDEVFYSVKTDLILITSTTMQYWREFLHSVQAGETFTFDPYGTIASPDDPLSCILDSQGWKESRVQSSQYITLSFKFYVL